MGGAARSGVVEDTRTESNAAGAASELGVGSVADHQAVMAANQDSRAFANVERATQAEALREYGET